MAEYTDLKNNTYRIIHSVACRADERKGREAQIMNDLYRVFTR